MIQTFWNHSINQHSPISEILLHFLFPLPPHYSSFLSSLHSYTSVTINSHPFLQTSSTTISTSNIFPSSFHSSSHSHSLHYLNNNRLTSLPNGVFSQLTSLSSLPSSRTSILISLPHILCYLESNSFTRIDMGNITPSILFVSIIPPDIVIIHLTLVTFNQTILSHSIMMIMSSNTTHSG